MSLKTSFFNKTLVKSDFKRLWWIPAIHTLAIFLISVFAFIERYYSANGYIAMRSVGEARLIYSTLYDYMLPSMVLAVIIPVVLAVFLFSYMQSGKSSTFAHSVPVSRGASFISHTVSGIIMFLIPLVVNGAILLVLRLDSGFAQTFYVSHLLQCMGVAALYSIVTFSVAAAVAMITGNVVANIVFTYVFGLLPLAAEAFIKYFLHTQLYGNVITSEFFFVNHLYLSPENLLKIGNVLLYLGIAVVCLAIGFLLYKVRNMENHSEVVAFPVLRPVFVFGVAICSGAVGFMYFNALWGITNALTLLPLGLIGLIIATMLVKKSFRRLGLLKPILAYCLIIVCVFSIFHYDLTGYERRVPDVDEVEYVTFEQNGINPGAAWYYDVDGNKYQLGAAYSPDLKKESEIEDVIELHKYLIDEEYIRETLSNPWNLTLTYKLKNGRTLSRQYTVDYGEYKALLEPIVTTETARKTYFPILRNEDRNYTAVSVSDARISSDYIMLYNDEETINEFLAALKLDTQKAPYDEYANRDGSYTRVEISYKENAYYEDGTPVPDDKLMEQTETYYIRSSYNNTKAVIDKYNILAQMPEASDITKIGVEYYGAYGEIMTSTKLVQVENWEFPVVIEDPEEIAEVYEYCKSGSSRNSDMMVMFFLENGHHFSCNLLSTRTDLPECLSHFVYPLGVE